MSDPAYFPDTYFPSGAVADADADDVRTTSALVIEILDRNYNTRDAPSLTPFIAAANSLVNRVRTCAREKSLALSTTELELLERWLAAHMYCQADRTYRQKSTGKASGAFDGITKDGLESTMYGQTALRIDYSGCLRQIHTGASATVIWLGKPPSEQIDYADRD